MQNPLIEMSTKHPALCFCPARTIGKTDDRLCVIERESESTPDMTLLKQSTKLLHHIKADISIKKIECTCTSQNNKVPIGHSTFMTLQVLPLQLNHPGPIVGAREEHKTCHKIKGLSKLNVADMCKKLQRIQAWKDQKLFPIATILSTLILNQFL